MISERDRIETYQKEEQEEVVKRIIKKTWRPLDMDIQHITEDSKWIYYGGGG